MELSHYLKSGSLNSMVRNKYHLSGNPLERVQGKKIPRKIFWVSAEGTVTENGYLKGISNFRDKLGIVSVVDVETLKRRKNQGDNKPEDVRALLEKFFQVREQKLEEIVEELNPTFFDHIPLATIIEYLRGNISRKQKKKIEENIRILDINLTYINYLKKRSSEEDEFCIIIDRDQHTHTEKSIMQCMQWCKKHSVHLFLSNPCFEFWLLLHFKNVHQDYSTEELEKFLENKKITDKHTFTSKTLSDVFIDLTGIGHTKTIRSFEKYYLSRIDQAKSTSIAPILPINTAYPRLTNSW